MENDMKQKAEQLRKNTEIKIQKANEQEAKYQTWLETQKRNNPEFRDYDENPLVIKDYKPQANLIGVFFNDFSFYHVVYCKT